MEREELFHLISENAADMIAVVDMEGRRIHDAAADVLADVARIDAELRGCRRFELEQADRTGVAVRSVRIQSVPA